jgi:hypothetical protein
MLSNFWFISKTILNSKNFLLYKFHVATPKIAFQDKFHQKLQTR